MIDSVRVLISQTKVSRVTRYKRPIDNPGIMNALRLVAICLLVFALGWQPNRAFPQTPQVAPKAPSQQARDGQHDFDFHLGKWKSNISRLQHPLTGSTTWIKCEGSLTVRKVWDGRAQLEELEADCPAGHIEDLLLFLYIPQSHQWSLNSAAVSDGVIGRPMFGEFKNGRGEFYDQESFKGRMILVRHVWSDVTPTSHHFEQSFSDDGGKTWETNFKATLTREEEKPSGEDTASSLTSGLLDGAHDFDFNFGVWKTHIRRLEHPLTGSRTWVDYDGTSVVSKVWGGRASLIELEATGSAGHIEGVGLRLYNPRSHQWSLNWTNSTDGLMTTPMIGGFYHGAGQFYDQEEFQGKIIMVRNGFSSITPDSSRFEQAFSDDAGKTWETNWIMTFTR